MDIERRYPAIKAELAQQLLTVPLSNDLYRPCCVTLVDGTVRDRVYVVGAQPWFQQWGVWPEDDQDKSFVPIERVGSIVASASRLPALFANKLYEAGESGMGYTIFTVRFADGSSLVTGSGNAIDFIDYPAGQSPETVVDVLPHAGRDDPSLRVGPDYA